MKRDLVWSMRTWTGVFALAITAAAFLLAGMTDSVDASGNPGHPPPQGAYLNEDGTIRPEDFPADTPVYGCDSTIKGTINLRDTSATYYPIDAQGNSCAGDWSDIGSTE